MEILYILNTLILGVMLWRINETTRHALHISEEISKKTDELLRRSER